MKSHRSVSYFLAAFLLLTAATLSAQNLTRFDAQPGSKVTIDGSGNTHDWTVEGQIIGGHLDVDSDFLGDPQKASPGTKVNAKADVSIPVFSIKSGKKLMDDVMHEAMHQKEHPKIEYSLKEMTVKETPKSANGPFQFESTGDLTINGVTKTIKMPVTMERLDKKLKSTGSTSLKMTSYGIKPPSPKIGLGLLVTHDDVKITFTWLTAQAEK